MAVHLTNAQRIFPLNLRNLRARSRRLMKLLQKETCEVSITLLDDEGIRALNLRYLKRDRPTNVLSFPMDDELLLGDIVISVETAAREAEEGQIPLEDEILFLIIHGLLHLVGYDHEDGDETKAALMETRERELFRLFTGYDLD